MPAAWGAAIGAVATVATSAMNSGSSTKAANTQASAADQAAQVQWDMFNKTQNNLQPWMDSGNNARFSLDYLMGYGAGPGGAANPWGVTGSPLTSRYQDFNFDPTSIANNPQYQWQLSQGTQNLLNNSSQLGGVGGNALQALMGYGQGLASQNYNNYFANALSGYNANRSNMTGWQTQVYNMLNGQSSAGQNAAANLGSAGQNVANAVGGDLIGAGNARAAGIMGSQNAMSGGIGGLSSNALMYQQMGQNNPGYTNPITGIGNWMSGANYNGMMPNVGGGANSPGYSFDTSPM